MVPTMPLTQDGPQKAFEPINDLPVNRLTEPQIFYPTSESRPFNRVDAGRVFSGAPRLADDSPLANPHSRTSNQDLEIIGRLGQEEAVLLPADARIPHPHMIDYFKDVDDPLLKSDSAERRKRHEARIKLDDVERKLKEENRKAAEDRRTIRVETPRWEILVKQVRATREGTGQDGRGTKSPGVRYGVPSQDRKRAQRKIPTKVEV